MEWEVTGVRGCGWGGAIEGIWVRARVTCNLVVYVLYQLYG